MSVHILEAPKPLLHFRILSQDKVLFVLYDPDSDTHRIYTDDKFRYPASVWHWQEVEIQKTIREHLLGVPV
jgi:hypothetical protein